MPNLTLNMGNNSLSAQGSFQPNLSPAGMKTLDEFVGGTDVQVSIAGYSNSTLVTSLLQAFEGLNISFCSLLLTIQFLSQLLLVPQGTLHGQLLFLGTLVCSWAYNSYVSTWDGESFQRRILVEQILRLQPEQIKKYRLGTRTAMVVFVLLVLSPAPPGAAQKLLDEMLPPDTPRDTSVHGTDDALLKTLDSDAEVGAEMYRRYRGFSNGDLAIEARTRSFGARRVLRRFTTILEKDEEDTIDTV
ncbi:hypothetical protein NUW54_g10475 [Trametes sanguinea]|uniref:Uncharacterized protein n=1 Tax=Trametes sanguinea TaxID=158606 RepID=A0ACC1P1H4_9APHY|nr:hypothetical protein NUW54_g10475 [Trametes sanguinea]